MKVLRTEGRADHLMQELQRLIDEDWTIVDIIDTNERAVYLIMAIEPLSDKELKDKYEAKLKKVEKRLKEKK